MCRSPSWTVNTLLGSLFRPSPCSHVVSPDRSLPLKSLTPRRARPDCCENSAAATGATAAPATTIPTSARNSRRDQRPLFSRSKLLFAMTDAPFASVLYHRWCRLGSRPAQCRYDRFLALDQLHHEGSYMM